MRIFPGNRRIILLFVLGFLLGAPMVAHAQEEHRLSGANGEGMDTHLFRPAVDSKGFFTVNGSDILGANDISFGLVNDYGHNLMRLDDNVNGDTALVKHSFQGTFSFNYGIANQVVVGLNIPVNLLYGDAVRDVGPNGALYRADKLDTQAFSFIGLHAKYRLARVERGLGIALLAQLGLAGSGSGHKDPGAHAN